MFYSDYLKYQSYYKKNIRKIKSRTQFYNLNKTKDDISLKKMSGDFELLFDEEGRLIESIHYRNKKLTAKYLYEFFDDETQPSMIEEYIDEREYADTISEYFYDLQNRIIMERIESFSDNSKILSKTLYFENKEITFYENVNNENYTGYEITRFENGEITRLTEHLDDRSIIRDVRYVNDKQNNSIKEVWYRDGKIHYETTEYYDEHDRLKEITYNTDGKLVVRRYELVYNDKNDWITQMVTDNGEPRFVTDREIEYY